jgi:hypothetical protein
MLRQNEETGGMKPRRSREPLANAGSRQLFILFVEDLKSIEKASLFRQFCAGDTIDITPTWPNCFVLKNLSQERGKLNREAPNFGRNISKQLGPRVETNQAIAHACLAKGTATCR